MVQELYAEVCTTDAFYLGENCRWDEVRGELYWVDLDAGRFYRAKANGTKVEVIRTYGPASAQRRRTAARGGSWR
jgi:sugar lactone lactonase YvrE